MSYLVRFRRSAKHEIKNAKLYGREFSEELDEWLEDIANAASETDQSGSIDFLQLLEEGVDLVQNPPEWKDVWKRWWKSTPVEKVRILITVLKKRTVPWEMRGTSRWFTGILGAFDCEVFVVYEINHVDEEIVITKFMGLPGGD